MPKRKHPKLSYYLMCDDIRREVGDKSSLIGIYRGQIVIPSIPYIFPKLCFHLVFKNVRGGDTIKLQLLDPKDKEMLKPKPAIVKIPKNGEWTNFVLEMAFAGINVKKEGVHRLVYSFGEDDNAKDEIKIAIKKHK
jgi:hypothetical protein